MVIERVYNIPLRKGFRQTARYKKTKRAGAVLKEFLSRHMKQPDLSKVLIGRNLNIELWKHGIKNPPCQVKVTVIKEDNGDVKAELYGFKYEHKKKAEKEDKESKAEAKKEAKKKSTEEKHEHAAGQAHEHTEKPVAKKVVIKKTEKKDE